MTQDKKTVHLIIWLVFVLAILAAACYQHGLYIITTSTVTEPVMLATIQAMSDKGAVALGAVGTVLIGTLARVRTDAQGVTVENSPSNPVPTEPQAPQTATDAPESVSPQSPDDDLPEPPPIAVRNTAPKDETL